MQMEQNKAPVKNRREWVKNAVIVFLLIMLVLTFFSNTIMNYTLAEVSTKNIISGVMTSGIEGPISIQSTRVYEVNAEDIRKVKRVVVRTGQEVKEGQTIFYLSSVDDEATETQKQQLNEMKLEYQKALLVNSPDYALDNVSIKLKREELQNAINKRSKIINNQTEINSLKNDISILKIQEETITNKIAVMETDISSISSSQYTALSTEIYLKVNNLVNDFDRKKEEYNSVKAKVDELRLKLYNGDVDLIESSKRNIEKLNLELQRLKEDLTSASAEEQIQKQREINDKENEIKYANDDLQKLNQYKQEYDIKVIELNTKNEAMILSKSNLDSTLNSEMITLKTSVENSKKELNDIKSKIANKENTLNELQGGGTASTPEELNVTIKQLETDLETLILTLLKTQKENQTEQSKSALDIEDKKKKIEELEQKVLKKEAEVSEMELKSPVDGTITEINVSPGQQTTLDKPLAVIEIKEENGYSASLTGIDSVKAQKLKIGSEAEVKDNYDFNGKVILSAINRDKTDPKKSELVFKITGNVSPGDKLEIKLSTEQKNYENVVPTSAVKTDAKGKFVLVVQEKSTPLGTRYYAKRVDVTVSDNDDLNSAITGDFNENNRYVILTSNKPVSDGDQVRLAKSS